MNRKMAGCAGACHRAAPCAEPVGSNCPMGYGRAGPQRKNPPRISADGSWARQFTLNKTPCFTGPVNRSTIFFSTGALTLTPTPTIRRCSVCGGTVHVPPRSPARQIPAQNCAMNPRRARPSCGTAGRETSRGPRPIPCGSCAGLSEFVGRITIRPDESPGWRVTPFAFALQATADKSASIRPTGYGLGVAKRDRAVQHRRVGSCGPPDATGDVSGRGLRLRLSN
jgi:hypothetical protein